MDIKNKILYTLLVLEMLLTPGFIIRTFPQTIKKGEKNTIKLGA